MSQCDGGQQCTFILLNSLMGRTLDPVMSTSSLDDDLASCFSNFFSEKITHIRGEIGAAVVNQEFSVDFSLHFTRSLTFSHFRCFEIHEGNKKNMLFTRSLSMSQSLVKHMNLQLLLWVPS